MIFAQLACHHNMRHSNALLALAAVSGTDALHHMKRKIVTRASSSNSVPLVVTNSCAQTIYPGIITQAGTGGGTGGFQLSPGSNKSMTVSADWQGRIWGRTNCTFNSQGASNGGGKACSTGDCNGALSCSVTVRLCVLRK